MYIYTRSVNYLYLVYVYSVEKTDQPTCHLTAVLFFELTDSSHDRAGGNLRYYERLLSKQLTEQNQSYQPASEEPIQLGTYSRPQDHLPEREIYEALCRGEGVQLVRCQKYKKATSKSYKIYSTVPVIAHFV